MKQFLSLLLVIFMLIATGCEDGGNEVESQDHCISFSPPEEISFGTKDDVFIKSWGYHLFLLNAPVDGSYLIKLYDLDTNVDIEILKYNPSNNICDQESIVSSENSGTTNEDISTFLQKGKYLIAIWTTSEYDGTYDLIISVLTTFNKNF